MIHPRPGLWTPAFAGVTEEKTVIPAKAGIHPTRPGPARARSPAGPASPV